MKKILSTILLIGIACIAAAAQNGDESEIRKIHASLDEAFQKGDIAVFERVVAPDYVYADPAGQKKTREQNLEEMRKEIAAPTYKVLSATSDDLQVKVFGNAAVVTGNWRSTTRRMDAAAVDHKDMGRYTGVYEKRDGKWMLVAEHFSEAPHDRKEMEQLVMKAGLQYEDAMRRRDRPALERLLSDDYIFTSEEGKTRNKAEDIAFMTNPEGGLESIEVTDRKVRVLNNSTALETGTYRARGTYKGKAFDDSGRFTTTWIWKDGRWQIAADHTSMIAK